MSLPAPQRSDLVLEARHLGKEYGSQVALHDVNLRVPAGTIVGLIGPSGCGKTTLVKALTGIEKPTHGDVTVFGRNPARFRARDRMRMGYMPQRPVLFPNLSVLGNLTFMSSVYGLRLRGRRKRLATLLELVDLAPHRHKLLAQCSGGMQRRVALAATLVHDPELMFLDEPTAGVDPILRERFWHHFRSLRESGRTVVVPTQYVGEAVSCDLVAVMADGRLVTVQPPEGLARQAYGGDPLEVALEQGWLGRAELERLSQQEFVRSVRRSPNGLFIVVDQSQSGAERLTRYFEELAVPIGPVGPPDLTYDEIFVDLVSRHQAVAAQRQAAA